MGRKRTLLIAKHPCSLVSRTTRPVVSSRHRSASNKSIDTNIKVTLNVKLHFTSAKATGRFARLEVKALEISVVFEYGESSRTETQFEY
jgi:hypothetical protein